MIKFWKRKTLTKTEFNKIEPYLNLSAVSRGIGMNRMYLTEMKMGRTLYTEKLGIRIRRVLGI